MVIIIITLFYLKWLVITHYILIKTHCNLRCLQLASYGIAVGPIRIYVVTLLTNKMSDFLQQECF